MLREGSQANGRSAVNTDVSRSGEKERTGATHFFTASKGKLETQNAFEASPPERKLAVPGFMSGLYRLNARWISSYDKNLCNRSQ